MLPTVKNGAKGILELFSTLPDISPAEAKNNPKTEADPAATNHPGNPIKTPNNAANFTSPIPSFPFVRKRIPKKIKDPVIISNIIFMTGSPKLIARIPERTKTPGIIIQSGIILCLISIIEAGIENNRNRNKNI